MQRLSILKKANESDEWKARLYAVCSKDIIFWINNFCWTKDPRPGSAAKIIPFICYGFQGEHILKVKQHILDGKDLLLEKSRDMGATWCYLYIFLWFWLFKEGYDFLLGSQSQDDVDQMGNPKSLFPRLRMNIDRFPDWMLPNDYQNNFLRLVNNDLDSTIVGEANTINFSRQGRFSAIMFDEFAVWKESGRKDSDNQAWAAAGDASPCRLPISSAKGKNNKFYKLRQQEEQTIVVARMHWRLHPHKNEEWYEHEKARRSPSELAQEVDIDYAASVTNKAFESWNQSIHVPENGRFKYNPELPLELTCDFNINPMCWSVAQTFGACGFTFKEYTERTTLTENVAIKFIKDFKDHKSKICYVYGDPAGRARNTKSLESDYAIIKRILRNADWEVILQVAKYQPVMARINAANKRLCDWERDGKAFEYVSPECKQVIESVEQTQRKDDGIDKDGTEHHSDAWSYKIAKKHPVQSRDAWTG